MITIPPCASIIVGAVWALGAFIIGRSNQDILGGFCAGPAAAIALVIALLSIRPWRAISLATWPFLMLVVTMVHMVATLGAGFLLYFAAIGTMSMWLCLVAAFWAGLFGLVSIYASQIRKIDSVCITHDTARTSEPGP